MLSAQINAYYGHIRDSAPPETVYVLSSSVEAELQDAEVPQFTLCICPIVPSSVPRRIQWLLWTVPFTNDLRLHLLRRGSASAYPCTSILTRSCNEADSGSLSLRPDGLLALHRQGLLLSSFRPRSRLHRTSNITTWSTVNCHDRTFTG